MMVKHCDGCRSEIEDGEVYYEVNVRQVGVEEDGVGVLYTEPSRELCPQCMANVRPGLDVVDGKTDKV